MNGQFVFTGTFTVICFSCWAAGNAQNSAPSSHLVFDDRGAGDILINEVRVPEQGEAMYTYYEVLGWRGKGAGYAGIQAHPKSHLYIFSIWDHEAHTAPIKAVYRGPGTETVGFGGEGTGLKSWNFELGWSTDVWYTLIARTWPVADHTFYGFWSRAGDTKVWTHLVTMDVAVKATFEGATDAFIEDWLDTGSESRTTHLRRGWKRKTGGTWFPFGSGKYSVNSWDLDPGKRSYNYRKNWNGGVKREDSSEFYFMVSGGKQTVPETSNPSRHAIRRQEKEPNYEKLKIQEASVRMKTPDLCSVTWEVDPHTTPPFSWEINIFNNESGSGKPLVTQSQQVPHARSALVDVSQIERSAGRYYVHLVCNDILDRRSVPTVIEIPVSAE